MNKPFKGLKVLDLSRYLLGAYVSLYFADFGARVIKVEDVKTGDYCRREEPCKQGESYYHYALNRNKESVSLDLKDPRVLSLFYQMVESTDVLIENFRPGVAARLKIDYDTLKLINPRLIYVSFSAYGQEDPRSLKPLHDINVVAETGYYDLSQGSVAVLPPSDLASAMVALQGALTALYHRQSSGEGAYVDVAMFDSLVWWNAMLDSRWFFFGKEFASECREYPSVGYNVYRTRDGRMLAFGFYETSFWNAFCKDVGRMDLFDTLKDTPTQNPSAYEAVAGLVAAKTYEEWMRWLEGREHCITPVLNKTEAIEQTIATSPHLMRYVEYPKLGEVLQTNTPHVIGALHANLAEAQEPAALGSSTRALLEELGCSGDEVVSLQARGVIRCP